MKPMDTIFISTDHPVWSAALLCRDHPDWSEYADVVSFPDLVRHARGHLKEEHRTHIDRCMCSPDGAGGHVRDARCFPDLSL